MKKIYLISLTCILTLSLGAQNFIRSELNTPVRIPWDIEWGPDNFLWLTDSGGRVSRIDPTNGAQQIVYSAPDYFPGSSLEQLQLCFQPNIGAGTLGLAIDPDFSDPAHAFLDFMYSYNSGTGGAPATKFKIKRLSWDASQQIVVGDSDIVLGISTGYDHLGRRLLAAKRNGISYLYASVGDHGISETNSPTCYNPQSDNPNNQAQNPLTDNGKIHRFNMDGSIPLDNPLPGNSFYTRGHRNPQGLIYNSTNDILYDVEHGDRSDDEINMLYKGMNYGWKFVRGYHNDNNYPGEVAYIAGYTPYPGIANDSLVEAFYSWCATPQQDTSSQFLDWCTVAPSGGTYYSSLSIPQWNNSLLVVTLKDGGNTDMQMFRFKLLPNGQLAPSTSGNPNPTTHFTADQALNGRLRDVAVSADGNKIFLINNSGAPTDKITVYSYDSTGIGFNEFNADQVVSIYPQPASEAFTIETKIPLSNVKLYDITGSEIKVFYNIQTKATLPINHLSTGIYTLKLTDTRGRTAMKKIVIQSLR